ncbi:Clavaminate synthase-like protein [Zea mays]|uniref:Clavaminate synthase-like protein n=3 Tax=Zea mays TaxID=4577 RepID=B8A2B7_MAIZE|nr:Clavaminate synthase-like protein At3g21360-like [Zea mays]ACL54316.1 unknown [Zea mays]ONM29004.1 Clavaminate synthase-like protein [Zea mays]ONM29006.1 Clavaminate synthase-like protein [Zea mays]ONM29007.1 Clavaminate synthase-like protein [Zea mays]PWZ32425.1 Clavaminate synthase-like protein [Zea mays]|eukprot:NP_001146576.1 uncharacterized protein LOC100280172 [Zea mays]
MASFFRDARLPQQRVVEGVPFPAVLVPSARAGSCAGGVDKFLAAVRCERASRLEPLVRDAGALLLRGFPATTAADFDRAVDAFGYEELPIVGSVAPRTNVVGRVFTANDSPPDQKIPFHHEMAQVPTFPSKLFFFCEVEPKSGGETPVVPSHYVYKRMKEKFPGFVEKLEKDMIVYTRVLGEGDNPSSSIGRGWQSTFLTKDKAVAEERAAKLGIKLEWTDDGVKTVMGPIPAVKWDESRGRKIWFNSIVAAYIGWKDARNDPMKAVTFGDGSPLPADVIDACGQVLEEESVAVPWQHGDILLIDNWAVLHSRRSFEPPRRILASICK